jgi:hypothetical protein
MIKNISSTQLGLVAIVGGYFLIQSGFSETCSNEILTNGGVLATGAWAWYKRYQAGDLNVLGFRKKV